MILDVDPVTSMADKGNPKGATPPPLLLMPPGEGLTMNASLGTSVLLPVAQSEASLITQDVEGEADSFVGQTPPSQSPVAPPVTTIGSSPGGGLSSMFSLFQSTPSSSNPVDSDPFSSVKQPDPNQTPQRPPASMGPPLASLSGPSFSPWQQNPVATPERAANPQGSYGMVSTSSPSLHDPGASPVPPMMSYSTPVNPGQFGGPPLTGPPPTGPPPSGGGQNFHRIQGPPRYAQPPLGTYASSSAENTLPPLSQPPLSVNTSSPPVAEVPPIINTSMGVSTSDQSMMMDPKQQYQVPMTTQKLYVPVQPHWYFCKLVEHRAMWLPMSVIDSVKLEDAFVKVSNSPEPIIIATDGGRYDVNIGARQRNAIYWEEAPTEVRRCTWFYKSEGDNRFIPYDEDFAVKLEEEYKYALLSNVWHKRLEFPGGETIVMHNPNVIVHFRPSSLPDEWGTSQGDQMRPRVVKRGVEDSDTIEDGEPPRIDHVVFVCHGIGSICDLRMRSLVECVDNLRSNSLMLLKSHFKRHVDEGRIGRVEFLPVHWHAPLHGDATGVDRNLKKITLKSIPKLRHYTNDTLLDILFYTSPKYCQLIVDTVTGEMNRLYKLFRERMPDFRGRVSIAGHSLGSAILFDLLCHQTSEEEAPSQPVPSEASTLASGADLVDAGEVQLEETPEDEEVLTMEILLEKLGLTNFLDTFTREQIDVETLEMCSDTDIKELGLPMGPRKKLQGFVKEHKDKVAKKKRAAEMMAQAEQAKKLEEERRRNEEAVSQSAGSEEDSVRDPLLRRVSRSSVNFLLGEAGTGQPYVSYPVVDFQPVNFFALGSPIALFLSTRGLTDIGEEFKLPTSTGVFNIFHPFDPVAYRIEPLIQSDFSNIKPVLIPHHKGRKRLHLELKESLARVGADLKQKLIDSVKYTWNSISEFARAHRAATQQEIEKEMNEVIQEVAARDLDQDKSDLGSTTESVNTEEDLQIGQLNYGRRIDYVLQEKPIESFNDYLFALASHGCYWESEDTALLILKETYALVGVFPEMKGPQSATSKSDTCMIGPPPMSQGLPPPQGMYGQQRIPGMTPPQGSPQMMHSGPPTGGPPMGRPPVAAPGYCGPPPLSGFVRK